HRRHSVNRYCQEKRHSDDRFCAGRRTRRRQEPSRCHLPGFYPAVPSHSHDHHGCPFRRYAAGFRQRHGLGTSQSSRYHHYRRPDSEPNAHALHHTGRLSLTGPLASKLAACSWKARSAKTNRVLRMTNSYAPREPKITKNQPEGAETAMKAMNKMRAAAPLLCGILLLQGCVVGPKYNRPTTQAPGTYKEVTPDDLKKIDGWKVAQPQDGALHGKWWEILGDPQLNTLEEQVNISNQNVAAAFANFMAARALVREARAQYFPTVTGGASITEQHQPSSSATVASRASGTTFTEYSLPFDASWTPDLWGRVRNQVRANVANAQASAADLENTRLTAQAELAVDYFQLRGQDALKQLLDSTVVAYEESLKLTKALYETGIDSDEAVAQAETQLEAARAADTHLGILRSQYEHAIALLVGQPASSFSIAVEPLKTPPPAIPFGVPSQLLERRPDIAATERLMAQANAQIGVARAAFYPTLTLSASAGFQSTKASSWLTWPSRFWSVGPAISETVYDGGLRRATVEQFRAQYDQ